jgi:hypothetical protein
MRAQCCKDSLRDSAPLFSCKRCHRKSPDLRFAREHGFTLLSIIRRLLAAFAVSAQDSSDPATGRLAARFIPGGKPATAALRASYSPRLSIAVAPDAKPIRTALLAVVVFAYGIRRTGSTAPN